mgnify:CR=1 FL=1
MALFPPIRFLKTSNKSTLKIFKPDPNDNNLDYTEEQANKGNILARNMLSVEDASEIAKSYIFRDDVFENIMTSLGGGQCEMFSRTSKIRCIRKTPNELLHLGYHISKKIGGHYSGVVKRGNSVTFFDSMCQSEYKPQFLRFIKKRYGAKVNVTQDFNTHLFQPSGGFAPKTPNKLLSMMKGINTTGIDPNKLFFISQFDLLSQHHFCYIESLVYLCHKVLGTPIGPTDPEKRIRFIKSILWCLIMKYVQPKTSTHKFKYFSRNFRYYINLNGVKYNPKGFYLPKKPNSVITYNVKKINFLPASIARVVSLSGIIRWSLRNA